ncbi:hypothetical protein JTB14_016913 [Gonioctena quinquepunctata]|nr:hypothetical protein JTB14_016913 [Gonioctena quinquepunctata]
MFLGKIPDQLSDCLVLSHWNHKCGGDPEGEDLFTGASDKVDNECAGSALKEMEIQNLICENNSMRKIDEEHGKCQNTAKCRTITSNIT